MLRCGCCDAVSYTHLDVYKRQEEISAKFCEENPGVTINVTSTSDGRTVIQTRLSSNEMPDLMNTCLLYTSRCV